MRWRAASAAVSSGRPCRDRMWCHGTRKGRPRRSRGRGRRMRRRRSAAMQRQLSLPTPRLSARLSRAPLASCRGRHTPRERTCPTHGTNQSPPPPRAPPLAAAPSPRESRSPEGGVNSLPRGRAVHRAARGLRHRAYSPSMSSRRVLRRKEKKSGAAHRSGAIVLQPASACRDTFHQQQHNTFGLGPCS